MRHRNKKIKLGRKKAHRGALLANLASSLIEHKRINTTVTKAKALKRYIEPLVTKTKADSTHNRRIVFGYLRNKNSVSELFRTISNKIGDRPGGYTRIIKLGKRLGDNADMAMIEFVDFNELYNKSDVTKKTTRRGRSKSKPKESVALDTATKLEDKTSSEEESKKPSQMKDKTSSKQESKKTTKTGTKKDNKKKD